MDSGQILAPPVLQNSSANVNTQNIGTNVPVQNVVQPQVQQDASIPMDTILDASLGEVSNKLTVTFKKTVLIRDYETEVIEATNSVEFDHALIGIERMFVCAIIEIQMEYTVYVNLVSKGLITNSQLKERKKVLEQSLYSIKVKADQILGVGKIDKYLKDTNLNE